MLREYAAWPLFTTVGIDSFFYRPPSANTLRTYAEMLPEGFRCLSKVYDHITAHTFAGPRELARAGELNPDWLNADRYQNEVLGPLQEHFAQHLGPQVFEFQSIARAAKMTPALFAERLDRFFSALPRTAQYAVELRNDGLLSPEHFAVLRAHNVAHVFNSWTRMPSIGEQLLLYESITADFVVMRALLRPGRGYQEAVEAFAPYDHIQDENPQLRADIVGLARTAIQTRIPAYLLVNNRAEGSAPLTILAVAQALENSLPGASSL
jgi:uncharacterized protein YecE (DUF72 family)